MLYGVWHPYKYCYGGIPTIPPPPVCNHLHWLPPGWGHCSCLLGAFLHLVCYTMRFGLVPSLQTTSAWPCYHCEGLGPALVGKTTKTEELGVGTACFVV